MFGKKVDILAAENARLGKTAFEDLQTRIGITFNSEGVLNDHSLRPFFPPITVLTWDSMHNLVGNGIVQFEVNLLLVRLSDLGVTIDQVHRFAVSGWHTCSALGSVTTLENVFSEARREAFKRSGSFSCGASEMLAVFPVLAFFVRTVVLAVFDISKELH